MFVDDICVSGTTIGGLQRLLKLCYDDIAEHELAS